MVCKSCKKELPDTEFYFRKSHKRPPCKECERVYNSDWCRRNRAYRNEKERIRKGKLRMAKKGTQ